MSAIRINLLPHRQIRRAQQQKAFLAFFSIIAVAGLATVVLGHFVIASMQENQVRRNAFLKDEIGKLEGQIKEIAELKQKTEDLLERKKVVESLQTNRAEVVHLFDELARRLPEGVYLKNLKQGGKTLSLQGYAQSSARVSTLMRSLDESEWFSAPRLIEVRAASVGGLRVHEFNLEIQHGAPQEAKSEEPMKKAG